MHMRICVLIVYITSHLTKCYFPIIIYILKHLLCLRYILSEKHWIQPPAPQISNSCREASVMSPKGAFSVMVMFVFSVVLCVFYGWVIIFFKGLSREEQCRSA